ncbi:MAG TPA: thioredoxin-dependent thiol peroxidase [archaeon]|nr:thioredoxin-dependent thiol peroxidase [archaeon]
MLKEGDKASSFSLKDADGNTIKLPAKGKVLLYFYPRDDTPGCTTEACNLRDNFSKLKKIKILGVSMDTVESHKKFAEKYALPFPLLADTTGEVCKKYGVYVQKNMYGRKYMGIKRTSFLINNGKIEKIFDKVEVSNHAQQVLET